MDKPSITKAVKTEAPLAGAPVEYLNAGPRSVDYELKDPFKLGGVTYTTITAYKLTGKDIFRLNRYTRANPEVDPQAAMFGVMCRIPVEAVDALSGEDVTGLSKAAAVFTRQLEAEDAEPTGQNGENTSQK